jgi:tetratricopeptide (TPR) repeat protein
LHPDDIELLTALGNLLLVMNKPGLAATTIERALKRTPERPDLHFMAATAYQRDLRLETAIRHLRECVRIDPKMDTAWGQLGLYLNNLSRFEEAGPALMQAIQLNPGVSHYHWALGDAFYLRSQRPEDRKQAFELYRKALEMDPKNDRALYSFGMALSRTSEQQNLTEAIGLFERLVALQPDDMNAHYKLAELARRLNHPEKAAKHLVRFQELSKKGYRQTRDAYRAAARRETAAAHARQGKELLASGNYQRAAAEFQIALERNPRLSEARAGLAAASRRLRAARDSR